MFRRTTLAGQRWSALWNGLVVGIGLAWITTPYLVYGVILMIVGGVLEYWMRRRQREVPACPECHRPWDA
ncbi:MAG: hypothetical protein EXR47_04660 [Dehalococcoidia bacterium]|nr:hypothetical protein [Dehalococcoidia bacterium]